MEVEEKLTKREKDKHKGHRERLREKVKKYDLLVLEQHEVLELLLTYTIPRKDTNPIAHELIDVFGDLPSVINTPTANLQKVKGVGPKTALFFKVLSQLMENINCYRREGNVTLNNMDKVMSYFRRHFAVTNNEEMFAFCFDKKYKLLACNRIKGFSKFELKFEISDFTKSILIEGCEYIVIAHTHPSGEVKPSQDDIIATKILYNVCKTIGYKLNDHLIINETEAYSMFSDENVRKFVFEDRDVDLNKFFYNKNNKSVG